MKIFNLAFLLLFLSPFTCNDSVELEASSAVPGCQQPQKNYNTGTKNIVFKSADGGQTWQDISEGLPSIEQPEGFFTGEPYLYLQAKN